MSRRHGLPVLSENRTAGEHPFDASVDVTGAVNSCVLTGVGRFHRSELTDNVFHHSKPPILGRNVCWSVLLGDVSIVSFRQAFRKDTSHVGRLNTDKHMHMASHSNLRRLPVE